MPRAQLSQIQIAVSDINLKAFLRIYSRINPWCNRFFSRFTTSFRIHIKKKLWIHLLQSRGCSKASQRFLVAAGPRDFPTCSHSTRVPQTQFRYSDVTATQGVKLERNTGRWYCGGFQPSCFEISWFQNPRESALFAETTTPGILHSAWLEEE